MQFHVLNALRQTLGSVNEFELDEPRVVVDDIVFHDLLGTVTFLRTDRGLLATVKATAKLDEKCARCVADVLVEVRVKFREEYVPTVDADTGTKVYIGEDEEAFRIDPQFWLDLREGLRQYILLSEPAKPLCKEDCAGLCFACGADLNAGPHECPPEHDERWNVLAGLKEIDEGN
ncbi:MAG: DUF177 domain-containing protein [Dehalococcoidia bacterium]